MKAIVLVGGFGTRLRPLTLRRPKQMLPIGSTTMLERVVARLGAHGVDTVVLSLGYQPDAFLERFPDDVCAGVNLVYAVEPEPLDTAGAIAFAARSAGVEETFVAVNGDVLSEIDLSALIAAHRRFGALATIALTEVDDPSRFGVVPIDEAGRVIEFVEKPAPGTAPSNWINAGTYVLEPAVVDMIPPGGKVSIERETFPALAATGDLFAVESPGYWIDAGTPEAYLRAQLDLIDGVSGPGEDLVDPLARLDASASVSRCAIGAGAVVGPGCRISDSVIMAGARIGAGSSIERSIVGGDAVVGADSRLSDLTVVGYGEVLAAGIESSGGLFPPPEEWNV